MNRYLFQYCPKLCVFTKDKSSVLLCRRVGEADYDQVFSLIGGKMEIDDNDIILSIKREKDEEVGNHFNLKLLKNISLNVDFRKSDGSRMILPHYFAEHLSGDIQLSNEYSEFKWVRVSELSEFNPKIDNVSWIVPILLRFEKNALSDDYVEI